MIEDSDRNKPYYSILVHVTKSLPEEVDLGYTREETAIESLLKAWQCRELMDLIQIDH